MREKTARRAPAGIAGSTGQAWERRGHGAARAATMDTPTARSIAPKEAISPLDFQGRHGAARCDSGRTPHAATRNPRSLAQVKGTTTPPFSRSRSISRAPRQSGSSSTDRLLASTVGRSAS